jgi:hypothetical protein
VRRSGWIAWGLVVAAWLGVLVYLITTRERPLCDPKDPTLAVRLAQGGGPKEPGVIYLNWQQARMTQAGLDEWVRRYSRCGR